MSQNPAIGCQLVKEMRGKRIHRRRPNGQRPEEKVHPPTVAVRFAEEGCAGSRAEATHGASIHRKTGNDVAGAVAGEETELTNSRRRRRRRRRHSRRHVSSYLEPSLAKLP